jgi:hypothetical protein
MRKFTCFLMVINPIFDVSAHQGEDPDYYLKKGFRVVTVETNPEFYDSIKTRFFDQSQKNQAKFHSSA